MKNWMLQVSMAVGVAAVATAAMAGANVIAHEAASCVVASGHGSTPQGSVCLASQVEDYNWEPGLLQFKAATGSNFLEAEASYAYTPDVPEPATFALIGGGLIGLGALRKWLVRSR